MAKAKKDRERASLGTQRALEAKLDETKGQLADCEARITAARTAADEERKRLEDMSKALIEAKGLLVASLQEMKVTERPTVLGNRIWSFLRFNEQALGPTNVQAALERSVFVRFTHSVPLFRVE